MDKFPATLLNRKILKHTHTHTHTYTHIHTHMHALTHVPTCSYTHTHTHIHTIIVDYPNGSYVVTMFDII